MSLIEFKNVEFSYGDQPLIKDLSFKVDSGSRLSILGVSGSGKSTILKLIAGIYQPSYGVVSQDAKNKMSFIFQNSTLLPWKNIFDNIKFLSNASENQINNVLEDLGIGEVKNLYPNQLSGGMSQRANIACALVSESNIFLLDEPFSSLDYPTKIKNYFLLLETIKKNKITSILVTHDINEAILFSDKIFILSKNKKKISHEINIDNKIINYNDLTSDYYRLLHNDILDRINFCC